MTETRAERVTRLAECDERELDAALAAADESERLDAVELLRLSVALGEDAQLVTRHRLAELAARWPQLTEDD